MEGAAKDNSENERLLENFSLSDLVRAEMPLVLQMFILVLPASPSSDLPDLAAAAAAADACCC